MWKVEIGRSGGMEGQGERVGGLQDCSSNSSLVVSVLQEWQIWEEFSNRVAKREEFSNRVGNKGKEKI